METTPYPQTSTTSSSLSPRDAAFIQRLRQFIGDNFADPNLNAHRVRKEMAVSRTILYSRTRTLTGQSVHEYIRSVRLQRSLQLLLQGELTICQVAFEVGFNSHSYFDKCFLRQFGMGPKEYIQRNKNNRPCPTATSPSC